MFFLGLTEYLSVMREISSRTKLNPPFVRGLLRCREGLRMIAAGDWDYIGQVSQ